MLARRGLPLTVVTLEEPSSELTRWREACRRQLGIKTITVGPGHPFAFVEMMQTLRRNDCSPCSSTAPTRAAAPAWNFFGHKTEFSTAPALLAQHTGAASCPAFVIHDGQGGYATIAEPPSPWTTGGDPRTHDPGQHPAHRHRLRSHHPPPPRAVVQLRPHLARKGNRPRLRSSGEIVLKT